MAGISTAALRAWERRYRLVRPGRTASGYRMYSDADVRLLRAAVKLVGEGHTISEVARLPAGEILAAAEALKARPVRTDGSQANRTGASGRTGEDGGLAVALEGAMAATRGFDRESFEAALFPVLTAGGLAPAAACDQVLLPLLRRIGDEWERGELSIAAEHFGSALVRAKIIHYLEFLGRSTEGPRLVCACPPNERHEGGLMAFAVHAAALGWQVVYLGASTPLEQALETVTQVGAEALAMSFTTAISRADVEAMLGTFAAASAVHIVVGGTAALAHRDLFEKAGVKVASHIAINLSELRAGS
jgi:methanogenic corrinoid protein MtbC1